MPDTASARPRYPDDNYRGATIAALERAMRAEQALADFQASRTYRVIESIGSVIRTLAPVGSLRRRALVQARRVSHSAGTAVATWARRSRTTPRRFARPVTPRVSIVIPVHGQWAVTRACLAAIAQNTTGATYEVIVVDDKSPDASLRRLRKIKGIAVVPLPTNLGYVGATNAGIAVARGEFIVLLNNDTQVSAHWLEPLLERASEPDVGLVGAKLIYPDGRLQDAGGIIFNDGSAWNYGKNQDALSHEYVYARDVDYVSGACTLIRKELLDQLGGGLDEAFAPAYYDDVDLAFAVRKTGYRVVYEPRSIVVHDEGVSHGTDETQGVKRYQVINHRTFANKWATELTSAADRDPENVPWAARRRNGAGIVVVIDDMVPRPDVDAGSVRRVAFLRTIRELGYSVIFDAVSPERPHYHSLALHQLGIEVLDPHCDLIEELKPLEPHIAAIVVSRAPVAASRLFDLRRQFAGVPIIFDTVDLHYLRERRARRLEGGEPDARELTFLKDMEHAIAAASDLTVVVSEAEQELLAVHMPDIEVAVVSIVQEPVSVVAPLEQRQGVLFVGNFSHAPNVDAVEWYMSEIHPLVQAELPGCHLTVVGQGAPDELVAAAPQGVTFTGWVEDLTPLYERARVVIAPLRFGAGVKGKIGEALSFGVPTITTPIGAEGMGLVNGESAVITQSADDFARGVVAVHRDEDLWMRLSSHGKAHIDQKFGMERFVDSMADMLRRARGE